MTPRFAMVRELPPCQRAWTRIRARLDGGHHLIPAPRPGRHERFGMRVVDADPLVEKLVSAKAERGDPASTLRIDRQLPRASKQSHSFGS